MRTFPLLVALGALVALVPPGSAADECRSDAPAESVCASYVVINPGLPSQTNFLVGPYYGTYYLYVGAQDCLQSPISNACRGQQASDSGLRTPAGNFGGLFGLLYQESNGVPGLQREQFVFGGQLRQPDRMAV